MFAVVPLSLSLSLSLFYSLILINLNSYLVVLDYPLFIYFFHHCYSMLARGVRNVIYNYTDAQRKVRSATSNDAWGPSPALMHEIADLTDNLVAYAEIMPSKLISSLFFSIIDK